MLVLIGTTYSYETFLRDFHVCNDRCNGFWWQLFPCLAFLLLGAYAPLQLGMRLGLLDIDRTRCLFALPCVCYMLRRSGRLYARRMWRCTFAYIGAYVGVALVLACLFVSLSCLFCLFCLGRFVLLCPSSFFCPVFFWLADCHWCCFIYCLLCFCFPCLFFVSLSLSLSVLSCPVLSCPVLSVRLSVCLSVSQSFPFSSSLLPQCMNKTKRRRPQTQKWTHCNCLC